MSNETVVVANARLELLREMADWHEMRLWMVEKGHLKAPSEFAPLFVGVPWQNGEEAIRVAARECHALGEIVLVTDPADGEQFVHITDVGYDRIRVHDAIGEAAQESGHAL